MESLGLFFTNMSIPAPFLKVLRALRDSAFYHADLVTIVEHKNLKPLKLREVRDQIERMQTDGIVDAYNQRVRWIYARIPKDINAKSRMLRGRGWADFLPDESTEDLHVISLLSREAFNEYATKMLGEGIADDGVYFDPATGDCFVRGYHHRFRPGTQKYKILNRVYEAIGTPVSRAEIMSLLGKPNDDNASKLLSKLADEIRDETGLNTIELANSGSSITLSIHKLSKRPH